MNTKLLFILDIYFPRMEPPKFPGSDGEVWDGKLSVWGYPRVSYCNDLSCNHQQCPPTGEFEGVNQENNNTLFEAIKAFFGQAEPKIVFQLGEHCVEMKLEEKNADPRSRFVRFLEQRTDCVQAGFAYLD